MGLSSLFWPSNDGRSGSLEELSQIYNEPLLNELTDKLLDDINVNEFGEFIFDGCEQRPQTYFHDLIPTDSPVMVSSTASATVSSEKLDRPSHNTLETLLKSQTPSSCSPVALELINRRENEAEIYPSRHLQKESQVTSLPDLLFEQNRAEVQVQTSNCVPKPTPVYNLPDKPSVTDTPKLLVANSDLDYSDSVFLDSAFEERPCYDGTLSNGRQKARMYGLDTCASTDVSGSDPESLKRMPHNTVEKRYRDSINRRIDELRNILIPFPNSDSKVGSRNRMICYRNVRNL